MSMLVTPPSPTHVIVRMTLAGEENTIANNESNERRGSGTSSLTKEEKEEKRPLTPSIVRMGMLVNSTLFPFPAQRFAWPSGVELTEQTWRRQWHEPR
jgi:hypothetical protein